MEVQFLGGADEIGRSAVLVDDSLLLDYGVKSESPPQYPVGNLDPDAVVVSHGHLDHAGAVPALMSSGDLPPVHWTPPTRDLAMTLAEDTLKLRGGTPQCPFTETDVRRLTQASETHGYGRANAFTAAGYEVTLFDAGHIPGSAHVLVDDTEVSRTSEPSSGPGPRDGGRACCIRGISTRTISGSSRVRPLDRTPTSFSASRPTLTSTTRSARPSRMRSSNRSGPRSGRAAPWSSPPSPSAAPRNSCSFARPTTSSATSTAWARA